VRIGTAFLPQDGPVQFHRGQATDLIESIAAKSGNVLRDQHIRHAIAVEIAEAQVGTGAVSRRVELLPKFRRGILLAMRYPPSICSM